MFARGGILAVWARSLIQNRAIIRYALFVAKKL